jgi:hypothetical protein
MQPCPCFPASALSCTSSESLGQNKAKLIRLLQTLANTV